MDFLGSVILILWFVFLLICAVKTDNPTLGGLFVLSATLTLIAVWKF